MMSYTLNNQNLHRFRKDVAIPTYDRSKVKAGIVHVGIGGFHRAHQAYYMDQLLHDETNKNWGICGIALLDTDKKIYDTLQKQDGLYTLIVKELDGSLSKRVIGSIIESLFAPQHPSLVIEKMANPATKLITLTITEGGYNYDEATGTFNINNPLIQFDLKNPKTPKTIFGYLTAAIKNRKENGDPGFTIQSCDNIQGNGDMTKKMLLSYVKLASPELIPWIKTNISFPNSMVDRITPVTVASDISDLKETSGIEDAWPVVCESYKQWIIEDNFIVGRPLWEKEGVQFVKDVVPYENMKLSLLNAGHSVLGILGALIGYTTIDESVRNHEIQKFLKMYLDKEVTPILEGLEGVDLTAYKEALIRRFGNVHIKDQIDRICSESSAKIPIFILPTIKAQLRRNGSIIYAAFVIAAWAIYSLGKDEKGNTLIRKDVMHNVLYEKAIEAKDKPESFLEIASIFGDLIAYDGFVQTYKEAYKSISKLGIAKSLEAMNPKIYN